MLTYGFAKIFERETAHLLCLVKQFLDLSKHGNALSGYIGSLQATFLMFDLFSYTSGLHVFSRFHQIHSFRNDDLLTARESGQLLLQNNANFRVLIMHAQLVTVLFTYRNFSVNLLLLVFCNKWRIYESWKSNVNLHAKQVTSAIDFLAGKSSTLKSDKLSKEFSLKLG